MKTNVKKNLPIIITALVVLILIASIVIYNRIKENNTWELVKTKNNSDSYKDYLKIYPDGKYAENSKHKIDSILWTNALKINKYEFYKLYLDSSYYKLHAQQADSLEQLVLWQNAITTNSYEYYLKEFPNGKYSNEARLQIEKFLIQDGKIGDFIITYYLEVKPKSIYKEYVITKEEHTIEGGDIGYFFFVYEKGVNMFDIYPSCVWIKSSKFHTDKKIGINSTIEEFASAYPIFKISYEVGGETLYAGFYIEINEINGYFCLEDKDYIGNIENVTRETNLKISDFKKGSRIKQIALFSKDRDRIKITASKPKTESSSDIKSSSQSLPYFLYGTWDCNTGYGKDITVKFINDQYLDFYIVGMGSERCKYIISNNHWNIIFNYKDQTIKLNYNEQTETLFIVRGLNDYSSFIKR